MPASKTSNPPVSRSRWFALGCSSGLSVGLSVACALGLALGALLWQQTQPRATTAAPALPLAAHLATTSPTPTASLTPSAAPTLTRTLPARLQPSAIPTTPEPSPAATATATAPSTATAGAAPPNAIERPPTLMAYTGEVGQLDAAQGLIAFLRRQQGQQVWLDVRFGPGQFRGRLIGTDRHILLYEDCPGRTTLPEGDLSECTGVELDLPAVDSDTLTFGRDGDGVVLRGIVRVGAFVGPLYGMWSVELASGS